MDWLMGTAQAQTSAPAGPGGSGQLLSYALLIVPIVIFYIFLIHLPQRKRQKERADLLGAMKKGDEVVTVGGVYGRVAGISDQTVSLEIAPKIRIKVTKASIAQVTEKSAGEDKSEA